MSGWLVPEQFRVMVGGHAYTGCPVIVRYEGEPVFELRRSASDGYLGINLVLYGRSGREIGMVRSGVFATPVPKGYSVRFAEERYTLTEDASGRVVCDIRFRPVGQEAAVISVTAQMYMPNGSLLSITPQGTDLGCGLQRSDSRGDDTVLRITRQR